MLKNYFKTALRSLVKRKLQSVLSILSITIGLSVSTIIFLYVQDEFTYDDYHEKSERIYRLANNWKGGDIVTPWARTSTPMAPAIKQEFPEVQEITRIRKNPRTDLLAFGDNKFYEEKLYFADSNVFKVFSWKLKIGNPSSALAHKNSIVITEEIANKYFGDQNPLGKILLYDNKYSLKVTGILDEIPSSSHFTFEMLADFETAKDVLGERRTTNWFWFDIQTYLLLAPDADTKELELKFPDVVKKNIPEQYAELFGLFLQPLTSIHLTSNLKDELEKNSDATYSYVLLTIALFIMLMACINFMNQSIAGYSERSVEIGVRKTFGAFRNQIALQYLIEALMMTFIACILGLILVILLLPYFNELTGKGIKLFTYKNWKLFGLLLIFSIVVGVFSGSYPAFYLSSLRPVNAIRGLIKPGKSSMTFRNVLVTIQMFVSLILIISTFIVSGQLRYFLSTNLGFDKDYMIIASIKDRSKNDRHATLTDQLESHSAIVSATFTSSVPGSNNAMSFYFRPVDTDKETQRISTFLVDDNFVSTFNLTELQSLDRPIDQMEDTIDYMIVNQSFVDFFNLKNPVGKLVQSNGMSRIVGVVKDFNIKTLHHGLEPALIKYGTNWFRYVAIKVNGTNFRDAIAHIDQEWTRFYPGYPVEYRFLDDDIGKLYESEQRLSTIFKFFTAIAMLIAGLGLISLASFVVSQRTQEIGIRKVLGGSVSSILVLISKDFLLLIVIATILGIPIAYYMMNVWLESFAYRISLELTYFLVPVLLMVLLLILTIGYQARRASLMNPIDTLKAE